MRLRLRLPAWLRRRPKPQFRLNDHVQVNRGFYTGLIGYVADEQSPGTYVVTFHFGAPNGRISHRHGVVRGKDMMLLAGTQLEPGAPRRAKI